MHDRRSRRHARATTREPFARPCDTGAGAAAGRGSLGHSRGFCDSVSAAAAHAQQLPQAPEAEAHGPGSLTYSDEFIKHVLASSSQPVARRAPAGPFEHSAGGMPGPSWVLYEGCTPPPSTHTHMHTGSPLPSAARLVHWGIAALSHAAHRRAGEHQDHRGGWRQPQLEAPLVLCGQVRTVPSPNWKRPSYLAAKCATHCPLAIDRLASLHSQGRDSTVQ